MGSRSDLNKPEQQAPTHLQKIYQARKKRTFDLVKKSVDVLVSQKQKVSLTTVVALSKELDPEGKGVSLSALQRNETANAYYKKHQSYNSSASKRSSVVINKLSEGESPQIKLDRDLARVRRRYLKLSKEELVERLLVVEQALAQKEQNLNATNDEILTWRLKASQSESRDLINSLEAENGELKQQNQLMIKLLTEKRAELEALKEKRARNFEEIPDGNR